MTRFTKTMTSIAALGMFAAARRLPPIARQGGRAAFALRHYGNLRDHAERHDGNAVEQQNAKGGVLGCELEAVVVDPASDWPLFAEKARELLTCMRST